MFPLYDTIHSRTFPYVNVGIIVLNVIAFFYEISLGADIEQFLLLYGIVPIRYSNPDIGMHFTLAEQAVPFVSSVFLHGSWLHLIFNMWFLWIFGDNVEDRMGHVRYFLFYILCGIAAGIAHLLLNPGLEVPTVGASGAIAGVMGAYFILYPMARIIVMVPVFIFPFLFEIPAFFFLGFWFIIQFFSGSVDLLRITDDFRGIAWWAHAGGFLNGVVLVFFFKKSRKKYRKYYPDEYFPW